MDLSTWADEDLERIAVPSTTDYQLVGQARAELNRRRWKREFDAETDRREYERARDTARRDFESMLFNAAGDRDTHRKVFEERLAKEQMVHAEKLASQQIAAAVSSAKATKWAAWAAAFSAGGALVAAAVALMQFITAK